MTRSKVRQALQVCSFLLLSLGHVSSQLVHLKGLGDLQGREDKARDGASYYSFTGVPYAQPPLGHLRFNYPEEVSSWEGVRDATNFAASCTQYHGYIPGKLEGKEDCLFLNIHTKSLDPSSRRPVIVWIHGGAFRYGDTVDLDAGYILEQDVVFVSIQYRLGPFGFLTTHDSVAPGNYGLHDQHLALQFIQKHIQEFGGDKNLVTIMGLSAGGASVHYHVLSPRSEGLFHRAVALSGTALCWWASLPNQAKTTSQLGDLLSCSSKEQTENSSRDLVSCLRSKSADEIMAAQLKLYAWRPGKVEAEPMNIWSPRVDPEAGDMAILPSQPTLAMQVGQMQPVPFLVGVANSEGLWRANNYVSQEEVMADFLENFESVAPWALGFMDQAGEDDLEDLVAAVKRFYLTDPFKETDKDIRLTKVIKGLQEMLGDTMFNYPIDRTVKLSANKDHAPVWFYEFNYKHNHSLARRNIRVPGTALKVDDVLPAMQRPTHAGEEALLFNVFNEMMGPHSAEEEAASRKFIRFITTFATEGDPAKFSPQLETRDWKPLADGQISHFVFAKYSSTRVGFPFQHRLKWWDSQPVFWRKSDTNNQQPTAATASQQLDDQVQKKKENDVDIEMKDEL